jgi:hypothetical protein
MGALNEDDRRALHQVWSRRRCTDLDDMPPTAVTDAEVHAMIDSFKDAGAALKEAKPDSLGRLYRELRLKLKYQPHERAVDVRLAPPLVSVCVRGASCSLATRCVVP